MQNTYTLSEAQQKMEAYCAYQERCHAEVVRKLQSMHMIPEAIDLIIVHLIEQNFLNEERFACSFARGKHRMKKWGRVRLVGELKQRNISKYNIDQALKEIAGEYEETFDSVAQHHWDGLQEGNIMKKRRKFCDFLLRKGFESDMVYAKMKELENSGPL
jgi:regulatory protein